MDLKEMMEGEVFKLVKEYEGNDLSKETEIRI